MFGAILSGNGFTATARRHHVAINIMRKQTLLSPFFNLKSFWCPKKQLCSNARRGKLCKSKICQNTGLIFRQVVLEKRSGLSFSFILAFFEVAPVLLCNWYFPAAEANLQTSFRSQASPFNKSMVSLLSSEHFSRPSLDLATQRFSGTIQSSMNFLFYTVTRLSAYVVAPCRNRDKNYGVFGASSLT